MHQIWYKVTHIFLECTRRIYNECESRLEKSVPRIAVWHHEACRVMTNGDPEGRIFYPTLERIKMFFIYFIYLLFIFYLLIFI